MTAPPVPAPGALTVAAVQMCVTDGRPDQNLERAIAAMDSATGVDLFVLPELWSSGYVHECWAAIADADSPRLVEALGRYCRDRGSFVAGSMVERHAEGGLVNRFRLVGPQGTCLAAYDKAHLFPPMHEDRFLAGGRERVRCTQAGWTVSPSICFDLRFPEMYRLEALAGADLFLVVSAWPRERAAIQRTLAGARAIENQAFLVLCNRTGRGTDGTEFGGGSLVIAPDGAIVAEAGDTECVLRARLDPAALDVRRRLDLLGARVRGVDW